MPCAFEMDDPRRGGPGCQFAVPEEELKSHRLCCFHRPKKEWDTARIDTFNKRIFDYIDKAKEAGGTADLSGVRFPGSITFERYAGEGNGLPQLLFLRTAFSGDASFKEVAFTREVDFQWARFAGDATFQGATFSGRASFREVSFESEANFGDARFCRDVWFERSLFHGTAWFKGSTAFERDAWFDEVTFSRRAEFMGVTFSDNASFEGTTFSDYARFDDVTFGGNTWFLGDPTHEGPAGRADWFSGFASFKRARFASYANFTNRRFLRGADFRDATFKLAPEFHNAILHQDTRFSGTQFLDQEGTDHVDAASAYRTLKLAMESVRARDEEAMFYAYEQVSLRAKRETPWSVWLFSFLYEQTADYGRSFMRPLFWLVFGFILFLLSYALIGGDDLWGDFGDLLRFALQQVFQPFWVLRPETKVPGTNETVPVLLAFVAVVHSVLTLSFLTLFLLALRRRFRLD